jgi:DNA-binding transcriptional MerR regulator/methylmalonyl-CoA mutase cobalamin-binding subunit
MYTISQAADRAGVSVELLRAWERRYGIVAPRRTAAGYRLYDEAAIGRVRAMRGLVDEGWTPSAAAASLRDVPDADLPAIELVRDESTPEAEAGQLVERFVSAAAAMDSAALQSTLDEMGVRASFEPMTDRYLFPALRALGDAWQAGAVSVAAEHAASAAVARWMGAAYDAAGSSRSDARPVLVGLPPGARHELAALAFATAARRAGLTVHYLGADLPAGEWLRAARSTKAAVAVIGVPTRADAEAARSVARSLRRSVPGLAVVFGGNGAAGMDRQSVLADGLPNAVKDLHSRILDRAGPRGPARPTEASDAGD